MVWHPILAAAEIEPGHWRMIAQYDRCYGEIRLVRRGTELGYRADNVRGNLVGHYTTLRAAAAALHRVFIAEHARAGGINGT